MEEGKENVMNNERSFFERFEDVVPESYRWLIDRLDSWRASIATRSSIVLSANALLLAGQTFILDKIIDMRNDITVAQLVSAYGVLAVSMFLLVLSLVISALSIANVLKRSRQIYAKNTPSRLLFHPSDVVHECTNYSEFVSKYTNAAEEDLLRAMWSELFSLYQSHYQRYERLRVSTCLLIIAAPFYAMSIILTLAITIM